MGETRKAAPARSCPICGKPASEGYKPFCSRRCADIDLNRWLKGGYAIPGAPDADEDGEPPAGPRGPHED